MYFLPKDISNFFFSSSSSDSSDSSDFVSISVGVQLKGKIFKGWLLLVY